KNFSSGRDLSTKNTKGTKVTKLIDSHLRSTTPRLKPDPSYPGGELRTLISHLSSLISHLSSLNSHLSSLNSHRSVLSAERSSRLAGFGFEEGFGCGEGGGVGGFVVLGAADDGAVVDEGVGGRFALADVDVGEGKAVLFEPVDDVDAKLAGAE